MPKQVAVHQLYDLTHSDSSNEILLDTQINTQLHIISKGKETIITFPYGNKFDIINGNIIIKDL